MAYSRSATYPYPRDLKQVKDVEEYMKKLYAALLENDSRGEYLQDRATDIDLKQLFVRPEWYGAKGDGVTNDTTAIQAAIDAVETAGGGVVVFSAKTYVAGDLDLKSKVNILGLGWSSIIKQINTSTHLMSVNSGTGGTTDPDDNIHDISIRNLCMLGTSSTDGFSEFVHLLNLNAASDILVENVKFVGPRGDAVRMGSSNTAGTERHNERITIRNCYFDGDGKENRNGISVGECSGLLVEDCYFTDISKSTMPGPIDIEPEAYAYLRVRDIVIRRCRIYNYGGNVGAINLIIKKVQSFYTIPMQNFIVEDCVIDTAVNALGNGIRVNVLEPATSTEVPHFITIRNNKLTNTGSGSYAINTGNVSSVLIENNFLYDCDRGILINYVPTYASFDIVLKNNILYQVGSVDEGTGVHVFNVTRLTIDGNLFWDIGTPGLTSGRAITFNGTAGYPQESSYVYITNNRFLAGTRMGYHTMVTANHTISPATNRFLGNTIDSDVYGDDFEAYINDNTPDAYVTYDSSVLPDSFPLGRSISVSNTSDTSLPDTYNQGLIVTEKYYQESIAGYTKWVIQFFYPANTEIVSLSEAYYRKGVNGNTWSAWRKFATVNADDNLGVGQHLFGASATNTLAIKNGTAPTGGVADGNAFQLYSADITAGNAAPHFRTEAGHIVKLFSGEAIADADAGTIVAQFNTLLARLRANGTILT